MNSLSAAIKLNQPYTLSEENNDLKALEKGEDFVEFPTIRSEENTTLLLYLVTIGGLLFTASWTIGVLALRNCDFSIACGASTIVATTLLLPGSCIFGTIWNENQKLRNSATLLCLKGHQAEKYEFVRLAKVREIDNSKLFLNCTEMQEIGKKV